MPSVLIISVSCFTPKSWLRPEITAAPTAVWRSPFPIFFPARAATKPSGGIIEEVVVVKVGMAWVGSEEWLISGVYGMIWPGIVRREGTGGEGRFNLLRRVATNVCCRGGLTL